MPPKDTTTIDHALGARITELRKAKGISQTALGTALGVSFQQIQKYERGVNRVGAGRLQVIAKVLEVPVASIFGDDSEAEIRTRVFKCLDLPGAPELLAAFAKIDDPQMRRNILELARIAARMKARPGAMDA